MSNYTDIQQYFTTLENNFNELYSIASKARAKGLDPELIPESKITKPK